MSSNSVWVALASDPILNKDAGVIGWVTCSKSGTELKLMCLKNSKIDGDFDNVECVKCWELTHISSVFWGYSLRPIHE